MCVKLGEQGAPSSSGQTEGATHRELEAPAQTEGIYMKAKEQGVELCRAQKGAKWGELGKGTQIASREPC